MGVELVDLVSEVIFVIGRRNNLPGVRIDSDLKRSSLGLKKAPARKIGAIRKLES